MIVDGRTYDDIEIKHHQDGDIMISQGNHIILMDTEQAEALFSALKRVLDGKEVD